jgi:hypothetical protein
MYTLKRISFERSPRAARIWLYAQGSDGKEYKCCYPIGFHFTSYAAFYCDNNFLKTYDMDVNMFLFFSRIYENLKGVEFRVFDIDL